MKLSGAGAVTTPPREASVADRAASSSSSSAAGALVRIANQPSTAVDSACVDPDARRIAELDAIVANPGSSGFARADAMRELQHFDRRAHDQALAEIPFDQDLDALGETLRRFPIREKALFERIPDGLVTAKILADEHIGLDFVALRTQRDEFTDFARRTVRGHGGGTVSVQDWYSPETPEIDAGDLARRECRDALNVFLVPPRQVSAALADSPAAAYGGRGKKSWVTFSLKDALALDAKVYPDTSSIFGKAYILTFPRGTDIPVDIYPTDGRAPLVRSRQAP